ncbi:calphotin-like [Paramacrobiotus metropolitanus]|uniref:calphotin-like n=1 Tax=Paramacrobiotus metropolitanus TaxID=2943436 RepID=UPI002445AC93|nr:calphotin-like [Paramacrobiotus metropolitanus]
MIRIAALLSLAGVLVAQPIVPSENGSVWIQPNIMDEARGRVNNLSVAPGAQGGAWVDADKTAGINGNPPSNPFAGNNGALLVANPAQPGPLVGAGTVQAVKLDETAAGNSASNATSVMAASSAAGTNETVPRNESLPLTVASPSNESIAESAPAHANVSSVGENANASAVAVPVAVSNSSARADDSVPAAAVAASNESMPAAAVVASNDTAAAVAAPSSASASNSSAVVVPVIGPSQPVENQSAPAANANVPQAEPLGAALAAAAAHPSQPEPVAAQAANAQPAVALVTSDVNNQQSNQSFAIDPTKPIIAILPPGSNFTATWNASNGMPASQPLAISKREVPTVVVTGDQPVAVSSNGGNQSVLVESSKPVIAILPPNSNLTATIPEGAPAVAPAVAPVAPVAAPVAVEQQNVSAVAVPVAAVPVVAAPNVSVANASSAEPEVKAVAVPMAAIGSNNALDANAVASNASASAPSNIAVTNATATDVSGNNASNAAVVAQSPPVSQADHGVDIPVILPVGAGNITNKEQLAAIPGAIPIPIASLPVGSGETKMVQQVPVSNQTQPSGDLIQQNHRFELQVVDFELSNAEGQSGEVLVNLTAGALPPVMAETAALLGKDVTPMQANNPHLLAPESTTNYEQVYSGSFSQKASLQHSISLDLCGQIPDKGLLQVQIKPSGNGTVTPLQYTCPINLNIRTYPRESEAFWSEAFPCAGTSGVNTAKLWYKVRQWNINWSQCQQQRPSQALA